MFALLTGCAMLAVLTGCAQRQRSLAEVFPPASMAIPWILSDTVWTGTFEAAKPGLGDEAEAYELFEPRNVWLGIYRHQDRQSAKLTARVFSFDTREAARHAYDMLAPYDAQPFDAGEVGCWTDDGICFVWGRLLIEVFGNRPEGLARPEQAVYLLAFLEKRMPAALPDDPR